VENGGEGGIGHITGAEPMEQWMDGWNVSLFCKPKIERFSVVIMVSKYYIVS